MVVRGKRVVGVRFIVKGRERTQEWVSVKLLIKVFSIKQGLSNKNMMVLDGIR